MMAKLIENSEERRMFDKQAELCGGPLQAIAFALEIWYRSAPSSGSYGKVLAIYANECRRAAEQLKRGT